MHLRGRRRAFAQVGYTLAVLQPGQPNGLYHREDNQEDFLVLSGECLLLVEGEERRLQAWDFVHCPPGTEHIFVGAGDGPCVIFMAGARRGWPNKGIVYPRSELALRHGAGVETETEPAEAYAPFPKWQPGPPASWGGTAVGGRAAPLIDERVERGEELDSLLVGRGGVRDDCACDRPTVIEDEMRHVGWDVRELARTDALAVLGAFRPRASTALRRSRSRRSRHHGAGEPAQLTAGRQLQLDHADPEAGQTLEVRHSLGALVALAAPVDAALHRGNPNAARANTARGASRRLSSTR